MARLAAALALAACAPAPGAPAPRARAAHSAAAVFYGSSTTAGAGASAAERRWTSLVARRLGWAEVNRGLAGSKLGALPGDVIAAGEDRLAEIVGEAPGVVVVMYGANDVVAGLPLGDAETPGTFHHAAARLIRGVAAALPGALLVVCTPQPALALAAGRAPYDAVLEREARAVGAVFVPAGAAFPLERSGALAADALHLNDAGHAALAAYVAGRIADALPRRLAARE